MKLKTTADLIEPRSVVRTNTTESGQLGKDLVPRVGAVSRTGLENDKRRRPAAWAITANADDFRSNFHLAVPQLTSGGDLERHGDQDGSPLAHHSRCVAPSTRSR